MRQYTSSWAGKLFLSYDWGTSSFRLRLIQLSDLKIIAEEKNTRGIAETYYLWTQTGKNESDRFAFYQSYITEQIEVLSKKISISLDKLPVVLSGMASSTIGMLDLAYIELPFSLDGSDLKTEIIQVKGANKFIIISGVRNQNDVIRGEETKVVGCSFVTDHTYPEKLLILPGTHSKHITIKNDKAVGFKTYMTGEFFDLLANQSVLASSIEEGGDFKEPLNQESFKNGVQDSLNASLLHASFMVRTNQIFDKLSKQQNFFYLSGLLIGTEMKEELDRKAPVYLVGGSLFNAYYAKACGVLKIPIIKQVDGDRALIEGQKQIYNSLLKRGFNLS